MRVNRESKDDNGPSRGDALLHPIRLRIVQALANRPLTPTELKEVLGDVAQATLYRHVNHLETSGLIEVVDERPVRGGVERTFGLVETAVSLGDEELAETTADDHFRYFATFVGSLLADFAAYLDGERGRFADDGVGYRQVALWLDDEELAEVAAELRASLTDRLANQPGPGRRRRLISSIVMPDDRPTEPRAD